MFYCFGRKSDVTSDPKTLRRTNRQQAGNEAGRQGIKATFSVIFFVSSFLRDLIMGTLYSLIYNHCHHLTQVAFLLHSKFKVDEHEHAMNEIIGVWSFLQHCAVFDFSCSSYMFNCFSSMLIPSCCYKM